jgi:hypothetical protein
MRNTVTAIVLCIFAAAAGAQCVAQAQVPGAANAQIASTARPGAELIKTSAVRTNNEQLPVDDGLPELREAAPAAKSKEGEQPRHAGPAMLLAAVAVMSGIALRRYGARMQ